MNQTVSRLYAEHLGYVSDKWASFLPVYDRWFARYQNAPIRMLEVGVQNGGSLQVWAKYFANATKIVGCDINPMCAQLEFDDPRVSLVLGDIKVASVRERILAHSEAFDIIIDDGSHMNADIIKTFKNFYARLAPGGIYVIEDLHCSYWAKWNGGLWRADSAMEFFKSLTDVVNLESWGAGLLPANWVAKLKAKSHTRFNPVAYADIESISFYNSMCLIVKGNGPNCIGSRVVAGDVALVHTAMSKHGSVMRVPFQKKTFKKLKP